MKPCNCTETENVKIGRYEVVICKECKSPLDVIGEPLVPLDNNELYKVMMVCSKQIPYKESYIISLDIPRAVKNILKTFGQPKTLSLQEIISIIKNSKISELAWKYCDLNDEESGDYNLALAQAIHEALKGE